MRHATPSFCASDTRCRLRFRVRFSTARDSLCRLLSAGWKLVAGPRPHRNAVKRVAGVLEQLEVWFLTTVQQHAHLPRPGEHLRVFYCHLVVDGVAVDKGITLRQMHLLTVEISGPIEPR